MQPPHLISLPEYLHMQHALQVIYGLLISSIGLTSNIWLKRISYHLSLVRVEGFSTAYSIYEVLKGIFLQMCLSISTDLFIYLSSPAIKMVIYVNVWNMGKWNCIM